MSVLGKKNKKYKENNDENDENTFKIPIASGAKKITGKKAPNNVIISETPTLVTAKEITTRLAKPLKVSIKTKQEQMSNNRKFKNQMIAPYIVTGLHIDILRPDVLKGISVGEVKNHIEDGQFGINDPKTGILHYLMVILLFQQFVWILFLEF
jgi:hypothetical protein